MPEQSLPRQDKINRITTWVRGYRARHNVVPTPGGPKFELSCEAHGEGPNLVMRQLIPTTDGTGSWVSEIEHGTDEVLDLALNYMETYDPSLF